MNPPFTKYTYMAMALDPIHIGTGGTRLGRVDMTIVREPGTNLPKIPATSISGACRAYAAMRAQKMTCAGQGKGETHCGKADCAVCVAFGFAKNKNSFQGLAQFSDAHLLFFPVHSLAGTVWVTCADACDLSDDTPDGTAIVGSDLKDCKRLNLGWLMLDTKPGLSLTSAPDPIKNRVVQVSNKLFSCIVNDNLEVRTSVSIDQKTGAAEDGALFTYEALPRASVLRFELTVAEKTYFEIGGQSIHASVDVAKTVDNGLQLFEALGVGGKNTRGMGRLKMSKLEANQA